MTESPTKFGKVINFEGINFSGLYSSVAEKHNEQSNDTVLVSWQILSKELKSLCLDKSAKKACILKTFKKKNCRSCISYYLFYEHSFSLFLCLLSLCLMGLYLNILFRIIKEKCVHVYPIFIFSEFMYLYTCATPFVWVGL